jgi:hypothetical protein
MARPRVADGGDGLQIWIIAVNILSKHPWIAVDRKCSPVWGLGEGITPSDRKETHYGMSHRAPDFDRFFGTA